MKNASRVQICLVASLIMAIAGAVDAALGGIWDQLFVLGVIAVLCGTALLLGHTGRPVVSIRGDLARWLRRRSGIEGEPVDLLLDRAVASHRRDQLPTRDEAG